MQAPIRWGIIGCGNVTEVKSGPGFQLAEGSELVAVMRRNGALAEDYAKRHGVAKWYDSAAALIDDPDVTAVYIATPPGTHREYALQVCAAGKPAYIEKPMARNFAESLEVTEAFERAGVPLFVAYYRRALPRFLKVKEIVDAGRLGRVTGVYVRHTSPAKRSPNWDNLPWRFQAEEAGGGLFLDLAAHTLDILDYILGALHPVAGRAANNGGRYAVEDGIAMHFQTPNGALGTAHWNFMGFAKEEIVIIEGAEGRVSFSVFGNEPVKLETEGGVEEFDLQNPAHVQRPFIQTMVNALLGKGECASDGRTAMRTARVMDIALQSYYGSREDAFWLRESEWGAKR